jgi:hypothetical protein
LFIALCRMREIIRETPGWDAGKADRWWVDRRSWKLEKSMHR